jgi:hypothetical protein
MLKSKIETVYETHDCERVCQGDILRDFEFPLVRPDTSVIKLSLPYIIVVSQDCDLENAIKKEDATKDAEGLIEFNQYLPNLIFLPAFPAETVRVGEYLKDIFSIKPKLIPSESWKILRQNNNPRYHYLPSDLDLQVPELVNDFKIHYSLSFEYFDEVYRSCYLTTINELFRESLSQRFASYLNRIGLPYISTIICSNCGKKKIRKIPWQKEFDKMIEGKTLASEPQAHQCDNCKNISIQYDSI